MAKKKIETENEAAKPAPLAFERHSARVHVDQLLASPLNPRKVRPPDYETKLFELAESIVQLGVIEAPVVRARGRRELYDDDVGGSELFEVLAGERRWRASIIAAETAPVRAWIDVVVVDVPDDVAFRLSLAENDQREDMHPLDQCDAFVRLRDQQGQSVAQIAALMGRTPQYVYDRLRLEQLQEDGREALLDGRITLGVALVLARIGSPGVQCTVLRDLLKRFPGGAVPIASAQDAVKRRLMVIADAPFDAADASLTSAGACTRCPKRSEAQQHLFGNLLDDTYEEDRVNRCTDPDCWDEKAKAAWDRAADEARARGVVVADDATSKKIFQFEYGPSGGYVEIDRTSAEHDGKTWRELIAGRDDVEVVLAKDTAGRPCEVAKLADLREALSPPDESEPVEKVDYALEAKIDTEARRRVRDAIARAIVEGGWKTSDFWRAFARLMIRVWSEFGHELDEGLRHRFGIVGTIDDNASGHEIEELLVRESADMSPDSRHLALIIDLLLDNEPYLFRDDVLPGFLDVLRIDRNHHRREAAKAIKAERKAQEKGVAKSATKKKSRAELDAEEAEERRERMEDAHAE